jgi:23S rRNA pseudouridine2605 synthase/16S rRNA pseudouridine516 synthase
VALAFHKPPGTVVTTRAARGQHTVFELLLPQLPAELERYRWHSIGRLDRDTTGLLLFTNDARLVGHVGRPEHHLPKRYCAHVGRAPTDAELEPLRLGLVLPDGPCRPAEVRVRDGAALELTITEGRKHQVRRMLAAVGLVVKRLHREAVGGVTLDLTEGRWRRLTEAELREGLQFSPG